jgi:GxxExxY protein
MAETKEQEIARLNHITDMIINASIAVHKELGPGMLESAYETCLAYELAQRGLKVVRQKALPLTYRGITLDGGYRLDLLINDCVIVEVKAVDTLTGVHEKQLQSYLKLSGCKVGLLINFNVKLLKYGLRRIVNNFPEIETAPVVAKAQ